LPLTRRATTYARIRVRSIDSFGSSWQPPPSSIVGHSLPSPWCGRTAQIWPQTLSYYLRCWLSVVPECPMCKRVSECVCWGALSYWDAKWGRPLRPWLFSMSSHCRKLCQCCWFLKSSRTYLVTSWSMLPSWTRKPQVLGLLSILLCAARWLISKPRLFASRSPWSLCTMHQKSLEWRVLVLEIS
jgi:hypothetical protein